MNRLKKRALVWLLCPMALLPATAVWSQTAPVQDRELEEIVVVLDIPRLLRQDVVVQYDGRSVYFPLAELFSLLELNIEADFQTRRFHGFLITRKNRYEINLADLTVSARGRRHKLERDDFILTSRELYLRLDLFQQFFELNLRFVFAALQVNLALNEEFPSYKKLSRHQAHRRLRKETEVAGDIRRLPRQPEHLGGGVADWTISASPIGGGRHYYNFALGGMLMSGDLQIAGGGNSGTGFDKEQFSYRWHYFYENNRYLSQLDLGHVFTSGILSRQLEGGMVTNRPQVQRRYFQTIDVTGNIGEGWEVELYINNRLTDYVYTDFTGDYNFSVDIHYGMTELMLKMYGPNGEMQTERRYVGVPYNLIPHKTFEYALAVGATDDYVTRRNYGQAGAFYGLTDRATLGFTSDIPLSPGEEEPLVAGEATCLLASNLTASVSLAPGYANSFAVSFSRPSLVNVSAGVTTYDQDSFRNRLGQLQRISLAVSSPLKIGRRYIGVRFSATVDRFPDHESINMNYGTTASLLRFHLNYVGRCKITKYSGRSDNTITSQIFASPQFLRWIRPQFRLIYDHSADRLNMFGIQFHKRFLRIGQLSLALERDEISKSNQAMLTLRLLTGFADVTSRTIFSGGRVAMSQVQKGSVRYDQEERRLWFDRRNGVGSGSALIRPFLDDNNNGILDNDEEFISGLKAKISGGRPRRSQGEQQYYYYDGLRAYDQYLVQIDQYSLDNPLLRPTHENYEVFCNPNIVTTVDVPLVIGSEVTGRVDRQADSVVVGQGGIQVIFLNLAKESTIQVTTFSNGEFYYLGLIPGPYQAYIDPGQLERYGYRSEPEVIDFTVDPTDGSTTVEDINFLLIPIE